MCERRTLATSVLALLVAMSPMMSQLAQSQAAQGQGAPAPPAPGGTAPQAPGGTRRRRREALRRGTRAGGRAGGAPQGRAGGGGGGGFGGAAGPFTPTPGAKDLKTVLFNWTWHMGMLRSGSESELVKTLDYHAAGGTIQVNGQPCTLTKYRVQANYQVPGWRTQIECTFKNKQTYKNVETLSGELRLGRRHARR